MSLATARRPAGVDAIHRPGQGAQAAPSSSGNPQCQTMYRYGAIDGVTASGGSRDGSRWRGTGGSPSAGRRPVQAANLSPAVTGSGASIACS